MVFLCIKLSWSAHSQFYDRLENIFFDSLDYYLQYPSITFPNSSLMNPAKGESL